MSDDKPKTGDQPTQATKAATADAAPKKGDLIFYQYRTNNGLRRSQAQVLEVHADGSIDCSPPGGQGSPRTHVPRAMNDEEPETWRPIPTYIRAGKK